MPDIQTFWQPLAGRGDWAMAGPDLAAGADLESAVLISLFTDRRADPDDVIPDGTNDPRGWWGDAGQDYAIGSKLWLLDRSKQSEPVRLRAQNYIEDALRWLLDDGVAASVEVVTRWQRPALLAAQVTILEPNARTSIFNYQWAWGGVR